MWAVGWVVGLLTSDSGTFSLAHALQFGGLGFGQWPAPDAKGQERPSYVRLHVLPVRGVGGGGHFNSSEASAAMPTGVQQ